MTLSIDAFKSALIGGGARPNLFKCIINSPVGLDTELTSFMCKAAALPGTIVTQLDLNFRGRVLKVAGDKTFENWTVTMLNEASFGVRDGIESWMQLLNRHVEGTGEANPSAYQSDIVVQQLGRDGSILKTYTLRGAFPVNMGQVELNADSTNQLEEFTVEFAYQYWVSEAGGGGTAGAGVNATAAASASLSVG